MTQRLTAVCSTTELPRNILCRVLFYIESLRIRTDVPSISVNPPGRTLPLKLSQEYIFLKKKARVYYRKSLECQKKFQKKIFAL